MSASRRRPKGAAPFLRTELYFGSNKPDGSAVTPDQFQQFLNTEITPRFPDGLTLLHPLDSARASGQKIEEIRAAYETQFQQESVLRADEPLPECVSF